MDRPAIAKSNGIDQLRIENVSLFDRDKRPPCSVSNQHIVRGIRLGSGGRVIFVAAKDTVLIRKSVINSRRHEVLGCNVSTGSRVKSRVSVTQESRVR